MIEKKKKTRDNFPYQNRMIGHDSVAAKLNAACASPSEAAPSPKYVITQRSLFGRRFNAYAAPTACGICVAEKDLRMKMKRFCWLLRLNEHTKRTGDGDKI